MPIICPGCLVLSSAFCSALASQAAPQLRAASRGLSPSLQLSVLQVGELFRTSAFNLHARKNGPPRSLDTLTLKELFAMKAGIENRSLSAKMLAQLYEPQEGVHVQVGGLACTRHCSCWLRHR